LFLLLTCSVSIAYASLSVKFINSAYSRSKSASLFLPLSMWATVEKLRTCERGIDFMIALFTVHLFLTLSGGFVINDIDHISCYKLEDLNKEIELKMVQTMF